MKRLLAIFAVICMIFAFSACADDKSEDVKDEAAQTESTDEGKTEDNAASENAEADSEAKTEDAATATDKIVIETDFGIIKADLLPKYAPITVKNFKKLVSEGFYDGLTFYRIVDGFMIQGGDPLGNGSGGSKDKIKGEFSANGVDNPITHERGVLSMARKADDYDSASSQFFIMHADVPQLDGNYAAFGRVSEGMEVVDAIAESARGRTNANGIIVSGEKPKIIKIYFE